MRKGDGLKKKDGGKRDDLSKQSSGADFQPIRREKADL
jgi:hypothetical protein